MSSSRARASASVAPRVPVDRVVGVLEQVRAGLVGEPVHAPSLPRARILGRMPALPSGTVTFVFTDVEGSTALLKQLGDRYDEVLSDHRRLMRERFTERGGVEIDTQGDAFFFAFPRARDAVAAAVEAQRAHAEHDWPDGVDVLVRMGLHTGEPAVGERGIPRARRRPRGAALHGRDAAATCCSPRRPGRSSARRCPRASRSSRSASGG